MVIITANRFICKTAARPYKIVIVLCTPYVKCKLNDNGGKRQNKGKKNYSPTEEVLQQDELNDFNLG